MRLLYPEIGCNEKFTLSVDNHIVYYEESGQPEGIPVMFLHGGPGSGSNENHRRYFDPNKYRIIIFDQRGCNRSSPQGSVENNTTQDLLQDIERIRECLSIKHWLVFGGSWGATLGLLYAETYPDRVLGMILRGTFLARQQDLKWFAQEGVNLIFPDYWQDFIRVIPENERNDLIFAFHQRLFGKDEKIKQDCARAWSKWAGKVVTYTLDEVDNEEEDIKTIVSEVLIETHYAKNSYFIKENQVLNDVSKIPDVPLIIIHGRRDLTCTFNSSWLLHKALPNSKLVTIPNAGHLAGETEMVDALVTATDRMADLLA